MTRLLNYRKLLLSAVVIAFVSSLAYAGTQSFFSDTETSTGNTFTAGSIDLKVDSQAHYAGLVCNDNGVWQVEGNDGTTRQDLIGQSCDGTWTMTDLGPTNTFFNLGDLKPGDEGENTISLHVNNNDAYVCAVINNMQDDDNGLTEPEQDAGDTTGGPGQGELSQQLHFFAWEDNGVGENHEGAGDNIWQDGEKALFSNEQGPAGDVLNGVSYPLYTPDNGALGGGDNTYVGLYWCYGDITVSGPGNISCSGASATNETQTDSLKANISFYVEQARNNSGFTCPTPEEIQPDVNGSVVTQDDLAVDQQSLENDPTAWFFYDDTADAIMPIDEFLGDGGENHMDTIDGVAGAKMLLADTSSRYNIATYRYSGIPLSSIGTLQYRVYDATDDSDKPFLNFNVDFDGSDSWQQRLVYVPGAAGNPDLTPNTWTVVDTLQGGNGMWTWSGYATHGHQWPAETGTALPNSSDQYQKWSDIVAAYPGIQTRTNDSWLGVRVGEPGPAGATGYVDWVNFNGETSDFEL